MSQTISIVMTGQLPYPPYESVFWTVYNEPDPTGALSQYGANYLLNVGVDSISIDGSAVNPLTLTVGGDLTGSLPNPFVSGLQGNPIAVTTPTIGQLLAWNGSAWSPASTPPITSIDVPASATFQITQDTQTSNIATHGMTVQTQAPFASATGSNRLPGDYTINIPAAAGALASTTSGNFNLNFGGTNYLNINANPSIPQAIVTFPQTAQLLDVTALSSTNNLFIDAESLNLAGSLTLNLDSPGFSITSSGDVTQSCDNDYTVNAGGNYTINGLGGLMSIVNQGSGFLLSDPGGGGITIDCNGGGSLIISAQGGIQYTTAGFSVDPQTNFNFLLADNPTSSGTGYQFLIQAGAAQVGSGTGGNVQLNPGQGTNTATSGNVALFSAPSSAAGTAGGSNTLWVGNRTTAPGTNPVNGFIMYSESGVAKIRAGANTVTLGNKPTVTGSRASGAALVSLLSILQTAGLITDSTT